MRFSLFLRKKSEDRYVRRGGTVGSNGGKAASLAGSREGRRKRKALRAGLFVAAEATTHNAGAEAGALWARFVVSRHVSEATCSTTV